MGNYLQLHLHLVWSTKHRRPWLSHEVRRRLFPYFRATIEGQRGRVRAVGGWTDHVHLYAKLPSYMSVGQLVAVVKSRSCRWIRTTIPGLEQFGWQRGYGAFSVDPRRPHALMEYIRNQERHHSTVPYPDEFTSIVASYGLDAVGDSGD